MPWGPKRGVAISNLVPATPETIVRIYNTADERGVGIGEVLRLVMYALERGPGRCRTLEGADNLGPSLPDGFGFHSDVIMIAP
jgi:hypothetical protein